jgi:uncharacterized protein
MPEYMLLTVLIIFAGALLQGLAGFGSALLSIPLVLFYSDPKWAVPVVVLCYTISRVPTLFILRKDLMWDHSLLLVAASAPGAFLGTLLLKNVEAGLMMKILGALLILFAVYKITAPGLKLAFSKTWALPVGFLSGLLGGAFGMNGPPVAVYATLKPWPKEKVVGMFQGFFLFANVITIGSYGYHGLLTPSVLQMCGVAAPFAVMGILLGLKINRRMSQRHFEVILSVLIAIMGFALWLR